MVSIPKISRKKNEILWTSAKWGGLRSKPNLLLNKRMGILQSGSIWCLVQEISQQFHWSRRFCSPPPVKVGLSRVFKINSIANTFVQVNISGWYIYVKCQAVIELNGSYRYKKLQFCIFFCKNNFVDQLSIFLSLFLYLFYNFSKIQCYISIWLNE